MGRERGTQEHLHGRLTTRATRARRPEGERGDEEGRGKRAMGDRRHEREVWPLARGSTVTARTSPQPAQWSTAKDLDQYQLSASVISAVCTDIDDWGVVESNIARTTSLFQRAPCVDTAMALLELPSTREVELETLLRKREQELADRTVSSISSTRRNSMLTSP
jgi:hypothetical protein